jgi:uncharacterized protein YndB with AHSA1/START domain
MNALKESTTPTVSRLVDASPDQVWHVLSDGWVYPTWVVGASRMRHVDDDWPEKGSQLHHSVGNWPLLINDKTEVLESMPPTRLRMHAHGWPAGTAEVLIELEPQDGRTLVTIREDARSGPARLLPKPLRQLAIVPRNKEALKRLAFIAEGTASQPSAR